jgi:sugar phosphate isomerase/epimerase
VKRLDDSSAVLSRAGLLGAAAAAAVGLDSAAKAATPSGGIAPSRRALMLYTVRDLVTADPAVYPTLPAGYREVFHAASEIGFTGVELYSPGPLPRFAQHADADGGPHPAPARIRTWLDEAHLRAVGHYTARLTPATVDEALTVAGQLGQPLTGSADATGELRQRKQVDAVIATWQRFARRARAAGIPLYTHCHAVPWDFLLDAGPVDAAGNRTRSSGIRVIEYFLQHTDPDWIKLELDVFWAYSAQHRFTTYTAADGSKVRDVLDPAAVARTYAHRCAIFHAKDGVRAPRTQNGWVIAPFGWGDVDLPRFLRVSGAARTGAYWSSEQDNAPGGAADPQKSLRDAAAGCKGLATLALDGVGAPFS